MADKEFFCTIYDRDLVDRAIEESKDFYKVHEADLLYKMATTAEMLPDRTGASEIYDHIQRQMVSSYLHGASYAVEQGLTSTAPSKETFSDYHKKVDFAILFDFSDNDFGLAIEAGAKLFCDEFNELLRQIDLYDDHEHMRDCYIKEFEEICKVENIKKTMKCGFMSERMRGYGERSNAYRIPSAENAIERMKSDLDYIPWNGKKNKWDETENGYKVVDVFPRFITGTNEEITEALEKYGDPDENPTRPFPVWCNGEVIILYMKDGYLTYLTR